MRFRFSDCDFCEKDELLHDDLRATLSCKMSFRCISFHNILYRAWKRRHRSCPTRLGTCVCTTLRSYSSVTFTRSQCEEERMSGACLVVLWRRVQTCRWRVELPHGGVLPSHWAHYIIVPLIQKHMDTETLSFSPVT